MDVGVCGGGGAGRGSSGGVDMGVCGGVLVVVELEGTMRRCAVSGTHGGGSDGVDMCVW